MTVQEAATEIGCSPALVYKLCRLKKLRHHRIGIDSGKIVIRPDAIVEYLNGCEIAPYGEGQGDEPKQVRRVKGVVVPDIVGEYLRERRERLARPRNSRRA